MAEFTDVTEVATRPFHGSSRPGDATSPGEVTWRAREPDTGRWVLVKRLPGAFGKARTTHALGLRHEQIVPVRRWLGDSGSLYIVRDWVTGRNLREQLQNEATTGFDQLRTLLDPVLDALEYAHEAGQAHGALTPENVIVDEGGIPRVCDFGMAANRNGSRGRYSPPPSFVPNGQPTAKADYYALCEVYKEFLPDRSPDDEPGTAARARLIRNLSDVQMTSANADELRYKLDAVTRIAELLGFCSSSTPYDSATPRIGPKLVCQVTPPTAVATAGSGTSVVMTIWNEGDAPLHIEAVGADVVWLNYHTRFIPFTLEPDEERDLTFTLSAARLRPGAYNSNLIIRSNHGMAAPDGNRSGSPWHEYVVALPVLVNGATHDSPVPLAERLPLQTPAESPLDDKNVSASGLASLHWTSQTATSPAIACIQEPDPGLVRYGQKAVLHVGIKNIGIQRLRIDKVSARPSWLSYPGEFQPLWIEPGATQFLGLSVAATSLTAGDYRAELSFVTSVQEETEMGQRNVWREMKCEVRVRVVRGSPPGADGVAPSAGCATLIAAVGATGAVAALVMALLH